MRLVERSSYYKVLLFNEVLYFYLFIVLFRPIKPNMLLRREKQKKEDKFIV